MVDRLRTHQIIEQSNGEELSINGNFHRKDVISVEQFTESDIREVIRWANEFESLKLTGKKEECKTLLRGIDIAECFSEASTRTFLSFLRAAKRLGAEVDGIPGMMVYSSSIKGESWKDTIRTVESYEYDAIILRHFDDDSALVAAQTAGIPIISGGSGKLEHPTQALLDVHTVIKETHNEPANLHIAFIGDLKHGRTVHSLAKLMQIMGNKEMSFVSPNSIQMPKNLTDSLKQKGVSIFETESLEDVIGEADILYVTRIQKERFQDEEEYNKVKGAYQITNDVMKKVKPKAVLMHPLPRVDEILDEVDSDPRAAYFRQVENGLYIRMAILYLVLGNY